MKFNINSTLLTITLLGALAFAFHLPPAQAARVAGEEDVTPVNPRTKQRIQRPVKDKPNQKQPILIDEESERAEPKPGKRYVTIDFDDVDIRLFIKFISELTGKNFVVDKGVKGNVTIISPTKISIEEAYRVFESVLEIHGFTTVPAGKIVKVVPAVQARSKDIETLLREEAVSPEDKVVTQLIPLRYADPNDLKKLFAPLISKSSVMVSYPPTGMLIVTDVLSNITRLLRIIDTIDIEGIGAEISVVPLEHATASVLSKTLSSLFQRKRTTRKKGAAAAEPVARIVHDERTNSLILLASENQTIKIRQLIILLDKETPRIEGDIHVVYLQHANAEALAKVLTAIPAKQAKKPEKGKAPVISKEVQIVADKATNSLVITAKKEDFLVLEDVIQKLDIARRMVYIEALLMEVSTNKEFALGVEWFAGEEIATIDGKKQAVFGGSNPPEPIAPSVADEGGTLSIGQGFTLGLLGDTVSIGGIEFPSLRAAIHALQRDGAVHILSTPQIMTTDNEEAEIVVADNIPFLTRQDETDANRTFSNYEFKDVGVTLRITPQINQERLVRLKIEQVLSQVVEQEEVGLPTTLKRTAKTTVVIKDGQTVVYGGLIDETLTQSDYQVPCLGGIKGIGWLFKSKSNSGDRTNLYVFITPHIIENPTEAQKVYQEKREEIDRVREGVIKMYEGRPKSE